MSVKDQTELTTADILDIDIDAKDAQLREAAGKPTVVRLRGEIVEFPPPKLWNTDAMDAAVEGNLGEWAEEVLGDKIYDKVTKNGALQIYELEAVFDAVSKKNGMEPGKSDRSSKRSKKSPKN